jgi:hypothetical protein
MNMVLPALYLGGAGAEQRWHELKMRGVTHVLQVRADIMHALCMSPSPGADLWNTFQHAAGGHYLLQLPMQGLHY